MRGAQMRHFGSLLRSKRRPSQATAVIEAGFTLAVRGAAVCEGNRKGCPSAHLGGQLRRSRRCHRGQPGSDREPEIRCLTSGSRGERGVCQVGTLLGCLLDGASADHIGVDWRDDPFKAMHSGVGSSANGGVRRIVADFIIDAHAIANGFRLLTLDEGLYRAAFPTLTIETF